MKMRFSRYLLTVANRLGNAKNVNFQEIEFLKRHSKLGLFLLLFLLAIFFPKNLEYILEEVDLGIGKLFSLANVQGFWHKLWPA